MKPALEIAMPAHDEMKAATLPSGDRRLSKISMIALLVALAAVLPFTLSDYYLYLATQVAIYAIATLGLDIVFGRTGQLSLSHASFFGLGAYAAAMMANWSWPIWQQVPVIVLIAIIAGAVVAVPTLRLSGLRLSLVTLLFGELFIWAINHSDQTTGGSQGMAVSPLEISSFSTVVPLHAYVLAVAVATLATLLTIQISRSQIGRRMLAVRDSELAATSIGIRIIRTKITAFIMSAVFAGIAGCLYAYISGFVSPTTFNLFGSVNFLVAVILGGAGRTVGAWLGAAYIVLVPEVFTALGYTNLFPLLGGFVLIAITLLLPGGLTEGFSRLFGVLQLKRRNHG
ncbi:branched-chain amino acid ABC transporter permease [Rhizobium sp. BK376]|uniref:branched-chain amino acid ABC transporter permease n=1 Tax=Rhizobium sp. BK376 TaxID=2512149 RepID=UPI0010D9D7A5|nr:branched-chain amino acid ABC transporter permease [Rhizobium sp. BK376]TCR75592.1 amino acid/amide ABC transporter membrane protein 2 (HAAT family) [Rhizobium sp. BK376]